MIDLEAIERCTCHWYDTDDNGGFDVELDPECPVLHEVPQPIDPETWEVF